MWKVIFVALFIIWGIVASASSEIDDMYSKGGGCNSSLTKKTGGFHIDNTTALHCVWTIDTNNGTISLYFFYLFMHANDHITLYPTEEDYKASINQLGDPLTARNGSVTVITGVSKIYMVFNGNESGYIRHVEGFYTNEHEAPIPPDVEVIYSPIYANVTEDTEITYNFNRMQVKRVKQVFTFEEFKMSTKSSVIIDHGGTITGSYNNNPPTDFFLQDGQPLLSMKVKWAVGSNDSFILKVHEVDSNCSGVITIDGDFSRRLESPVNMLNNGTIVSECRWLVQSKDGNRILGLNFHTIDFHSVFDIGAVNDGQSELSTPLLQVTTSNRNVSQNRMIRSGSANMWISFKPVNYESRFVVDVTSHVQGGYFKNENGNTTIEMKPGSKEDAAFLLEVKDGQIVSLTFDTSALTPNAILSVYDGFNTENLLTTLHGPLNFPIFSRSSQLMLVAANASTSKFTATFQGISPGCDHMSSLITENYILSEHVNSTCRWIIPPQNEPASVLLVYLQYISLAEGDILEMYRLDANLTKLGSVGANVTHVPHIAIQSNVGALIQVTQGHGMKTDKVVLVGHSSYIPDCNKVISPKPSEKFQIQSPLYPDTYPLFTSCQWNITTPKENMVHLTFDTLKLAQNHCVKISANSGKTKHEYDGKTLPDDLLLSGDVLVQFDSSNCDKKEVGQFLNADVGFLINATVAECGADLNIMNGEFNTSVAGNKSNCIWKLDVSKTGSVNIISYTIAHKDESKNYELTVYDGSSVRDAKVDNDTKEDIWSRTSNLIFVYTRLNVSEPPAVLVVKFNTITCNSTMLCDNLICMHPDWKCNTKNDCGDFSDEKNCASMPGPSPSPPEVKYTGYSATAFWLTLLAMLLIGIIVGLGIPVCYQKYKDSRYTRFRELSGIDG